MDQSNGNTNSVAKIVIATGRNSHTLVYKQGDEMLEMSVPNSAAALQSIIAMHPEQIIVVGNGQWAMPLGFALRASGLCPTYVAKPTQKNVKQNMVAFAKIILNSGFMGRPFPSPPKPLVEIPQPQDPHPNYRATLEYLKFTDDVRTAKHNLLACVVVLFPEAVRPSQSELKKDKTGKYKKAISLPVPPDLWTKKMKPMLSNPNPFALEHNQDIPEEIRTLAATSLGRHLPQDVRDHYNQLLQRRLIEFGNANSAKLVSMKHLKQAVGAHPLLSIFPDSDSAIVLVGLLGWKQWSSFRQLQSFCGLAVNRIDSKGKRRISRIHPETRQYLYLMATLTKLGKQWSKLPPLPENPETGKPKKYTNTRCRWIRRFLKAIYRYALCENPMNPPEPT